MQEIRALGQEFEPWLRLPVDEGFTTVHECVLNPGRLIRSLFTRWRSLEEISVALVPSKTAGVYLTGIQLERGHILPVYIGAASCLLRRLRTYQLARPVHATPNLRFLLERIDRSLWYCAWTVTEQSAYSYDHDCVEEGLIRRFPTYLLNDLHNQRRNLAPDVAREILRFYRSSVAG